MATPEGMAAYKYRDHFYLAIANEVAAAGTSATHTTLYRLDLVRRDEDEDGD